jgi:hypothetical protein
MLHLLTAGSGTFETSSDVRYTAAFWGKADISQRYRTIPDFMSTRPNHAWPYRLGQRARVLRQWGIHRLAIIREMKE